MNNISQEKIPPVNPEQDFKELEQRLGALETKMEKEKPQEKEKIVRQEIKNYIQNVQNVSNTATPSSKRDSPSEISKFQPSSQIGALISLVFEKGLREAVKVAKELDNPAILDEFHDTLVDHYYEELVRRGTLKF